MLPYVKQLNTGLPYIASNGAELVGPDHNVLESVTFSPEQARGIIRYLKAQGFYVQCYREESFYFEEECEASANYRRSSGMFGHGTVYGFTVLPKRLRAPIKHFIENRTDASPLLGKGILYPWGHLGKYGARQQPVRLQFPQLLRQHFGRRLWDQPVQLAETQCVRKQMPQDQRFILPADHPQGFLHGAVYPRAMALHNNRLP